MKKTFGKLALAALLSIVPLSSAFAIPSITTDPGNVTGYLTGPGQLIYDFDTLTPTVAPVLNPALTGDFTIYPTPSGTSTSASPAGVTTNFLSIPNPKSNGAATLNFFQDMNYLGLFWGSVDEYNSIAFYNDNLLVGTVTGSQVGTPANGNQFLSGQNLYVHISNIIFDKVTFTSTQYAFELDNVAVNAVPEPATMLLFGAGIVGLAGVARRRKTN